MLTINADQDPLFQNYHQAGKEKRMVVILPEGAYGDWLTAPAADTRDFPVPPTRPIGWWPRPKSQHAEGAHTVQLHDQDSGELKPNRCPMTVSIVVNLSPAAVIIICYFLARQAGRK